MSSQKYVPAHRTLVDTIRNLNSPSVPVLPAPLYQPRNRVPQSKAMMMNKSASVHMTNEGWQLAQGFESVGYKLAGRDLTINTQDVPEILSVCRPDVLVIQDKREWEGHTAPGHRGERVNEAFYGVNFLRRRHDIFKMTIIKDAHQKPEYHSQSAEEMGCHGWLTYYHPTVVCHLAPYVRKEHLIRIYHSIDRDMVPIYNPHNREGCVVSGAIATCYPLRTMIQRRIKSFPNTTYLKHPGYHARGSMSDLYLQTLSKYKVSVATSSIYGYALRKIIESTACGCIVITDLPVDDVLPEIDGNLVRVKPSINRNHFSKLIAETIESYDPVRQAFFAEEAMRYYDWREAAVRNDQAILKMREAYNANHDPR